jgi:hypothetical protein
MNIELSFRDVLCESVEHQNKKNAPDERSKPSTAAGRDAFTATAPALTTTKPRPCGGANNDKK